jgi:hypothetical protein
MEFFDAHDYFGQDRSDLLKPERNIRMDLRETGCAGVDWVTLAQYRDQ